MESEQFGIVDPGTGEDNTIHMPFANEVRVKTILFRRDWMKEQMVTMLLRHLVKTMHHEREKGIHGNAVGALADDETEEVCFAGRQAATSCIAVVVEFTRGAQHAATGSLGDSHVLRIVEHERHCRPRYPCRARNILAGYSMLGHLILVDRSSFIRENC